MNHFSHNFFGNDIAVLSPRLLHQRLANAQGVDGAVGILIDEDALQGETAVVVGVIEVAVGHLITTAHVVAEGLALHQGRGHHEVGNGLVDAGYRGWTTIFLPLTT